MLITRSNSMEWGVRKRTIKNELKIGPISMKFITLALVAVAALFYIAMSAQGSAQKYKLMQLDGQKSQLEAQGKELEVEAARLKSLNEIKNSAQDLGLEPTDSNL